MTKEELDVIRLMNDQINKLINLNLSLRVRIDCCLDRIDILENEVAELKGEEK